MTKEPILKYFECAHLQLDLQNVARPFKDLAHGMVQDLPRCAERSAGLRKLLEAKDCAVRAAMEKMEEADA